MSDRIRFERPPNHDTRRDPHSPRQFRVIGPARNIDSWYDAFKVQASNKMFVAPENRARIW